MDKGGNQAARYRARPTFYSDCARALRVPSGSGPLGLTLVWQDRVFTAGQVLLCLVTLLFAFGFSSSQVVCRHYNVSVPTHRVLEPGTPYGASLYSINTSWVVSYGVWKACDVLGSCDKLYKRMEGVEWSAVVMAQALATCACVGYVLCVVQELASHVRIVGSLMAVNRVTELFLATSVVIHFMFLMVFTGEVKNRCVHVPDSVDRACWGFNLLAASWAGALTVVMVMSMFRRVPRWRRPRRHWNIPEHLNFRQTR